MDSVVKQKFLGALRGDRYAWARGALRQAPKTPEQAGKMCCCGMGVLGDVYIQEHPGGAFRWSENPNTPGAYALVGWTKINGDAHLIEEYANLPKEILVWAGISCEEARYAVGYNDILANNLLQVADYIERCF